MSFAKCCSFRLGLNVLKTLQWSLTPKRSSKCGKRVHVMTSSWLHGCAIAGVVIHDSCISRMLDLCRYKGSRSHGLCSSVLCILPHWRGWNHVWYHPDFDHIDKVIYQNNGLKYHIQYISGMKHPIEFYCSLLMASSSRVTQVYETANSIST